ncbi:MAG: pilus assembly PilX N-terminal domain-containing protein [Deltaproteobacteria bacterium]|nr:pilus assembly PilX N-terminal domain-containing protein [Deltaproteobacteria bacterium]
MSQKIKLFLHQEHHRGAALIIALMIMAVLSLLGAASLTTTNIEVRVAGNDRCAQDAFYAAEAGMQFAIAGLQRQITEVAANFIVTQQSVSWGPALNGQGGITPATGLDVTTGGTWLGNTSASQTTPYATKTSGANLKTYGVPFPSAAAPTAWYLVTIWNNLDGGTATTDNDKIINVRADALNSCGGKNTIEVALFALPSPQNVTGYTAQAGAGAGKNYNSQDANAITTFTGQNMGGIT